MTKKNNVLDCLLLRCLVSLICKAMPVFGLKIRDDESILFLFFGFFQVNVTEKNRMCLIVIYFDI